ncbi:MAG: LPS assembly protein LptD [Kiritimatiellales bacterium]|nr:LPS assembly protein LptD [Kiritimatiellales bacterium]
MNLKQNCAHFAKFLAVFTLLTATGCSTALPYQESRAGNYFYLNPLSHKPATSKDHLAYVQSLRDQGHLTRAREQAEVLVKRWPDSAEAAAAKQAVADIYFEQGKNQKAFTAYEELIKQYYTGIKDYDAILDRQYTLATKEMNRKRMRWLFGGYRAPERAVPLFESIIQNAPQWERAPEMQYMIGQAYQKNDEQEMAVVAYSTVEYRYPDSSFAEKSAVAKLDSFKELVESVPYSVDIREQAQLSAGMFPELYTNSQHIAEVQMFSNNLRDLSAQYNYEIGQFYERVPRPARNESAAIYYRKVNDQFAGTQYAALAAERLRVLFPGGDVMLADGTKAPIRPAGGGVAAGAGIGTGTGSAVRVEPKELPARTVTDPDAIEVTADRLEYSGDLLVGEGNVAVQQTGASLQADRVTVNSETGEIRASGNVLMIREDNRWEGQELVYNYKTREGTFGKSFMYFDPAYITADRTERISTNEFVMYNATITTCSGENPAVYVKAKEVRVLDEKKASGVFLKAKHVTFYVGPVPVFYTPVWQRHLGYRVFTWTVGVGGNLGAFVMGRATLHPTEWLTSITHFDLYSARGLGLGQDFKWTTPHGKGGIETYYINDGDPYGGKNDNAIEKALIDSERYRVKITHHEQIDDETYFATQINWLSDPMILRDFFNDEYARSANPENYAVVQRSTEDYAASLRIDHRMNDFYTAVDRNPELTYDRYRSQIGESPFVFESENSAVYLDSLHSSTNAPLIPDYNSVRLDTHNQVFLPLRFDEFFNVIPRAGYRGTWYSNTPGGDAKLRNMFELGTLTSFKAYKTLTEKSSYFGTGLQHIVEPYADYSYRYSTVHTNELYQFDSIDALDEQNAILFGTRNLLQSKRGAKRIANVLDSDIHTSYRVDPASGEKRFGNLVADAEMSLTDNLYLRAGAEYNWYTRELSPANARIKWVTEDQSEYSFEYRYLAGTRSLFTPRARLFPNDKWSYELSASYDSLYDEWYERKILINHKFDCIGMGVGLKIDKDDQPMLWLQFWLNAFPESLLNL